MTVRAAASEAHWLELDTNAAAAAVGFLVQSMKSNDLHSIFKALYVADLLHLERYGRLIADESYNAMDYGPVPFAIYNSLCAMRGDERFPIMNEELYSKLESVVAMRDLRHLDLAGEPDLDDLSESDIMCLAEAAEKVDANNFRANTDLTHDEAWKAARARRPNAPIRLGDMIDQLDDAERIREHLGHLRSG
ncbi:MAG: Panacea domain-containing protein [Trueperaceae bacterium]|nr:Panacea domain-containing protein [Trueperaceae bacterium]